MGVRDLVQHLLQTRLCDPFEAYLLATIIYSRLMKQYLKPILNVNQAIIAGWLDTFNAGL